jgi:hypothetical protein
LGEKLEFLCAKGTEKLYCHLMAYNNDRKRQIAALASLKIAETLKFTQIASLSSVKKWFQD